MFAWIARKSGPCPRACRAVGTIFLLLSMLAAPCSPVQAQLLTLLGTATVPLPAVGPATVSVPINILGNKINVSVNVIATAGAINLLPTSVVVNIAGRPVTLNILAGTIPILGGPTINITINVTLPAAILSGALNTIGASVALRRNDALLSLDAGLDRQIGLLGPEFERRAGWSDAMLPGTLRFGDGADHPFAVARSGRADTFNTEQASFSTSLQKIRAANADIAQPNGLGATARAPAPPTKSAFDVWSEGSFAWFNDASGSAERHGLWGVLYVGADYRVSGDLLVGALVQFDQSSQEFDAFPGNTRSSGWLAGPYTAVRLSKNLFFQARAAWGLSTTEIALDGNAHDKVDAERWLVRGTLLGQWQDGAWQFRPRAVIGYIEERQEGYQSQIGVPVPGQTLALGQFKAGPEIAYQHRLSDGTAVEPSLLLEGVWNFLQDAGASSLADQSIGEKLRGRAEAGLSLRTAGGIGVGATVSYDGIGASDYQSIAGKARVRVPLN
jgi:hypothetical protein